MSALEGLRRQNEAAFAAIDELTTSIFGIGTELVALRARVVTLEAQRRSEQSPATSPEAVTGVTTPPVAPATKSTSATPAPTSAQKPATGKS